MPTEAEWEYAARAGTTTTYYCGDDPSCLASIAWDVDNANWTTHPACQLSPNNLTLCDALGDVDQWVNDWYDPNYYAASPAGDPQGPTGSPEGARVVRGGSWLDVAATLRVSARGWIDPATKVDVVGFRCAQDATDDDDDDNDDNDDDDNDDNDNDDNNDDDNNDDDNDDDDNDDDDSDDDDGSPADDDAARADDDSTPVHDHAESAAKTGCGC